jgi:hypothetical protein
MRLRLSFRLLLATALGVGWLGVGTVASVADKVDGLFANHYSI